MTDPRLLHHDELVVALDYGQLYLYTADNDPDLAATVLAQAQDTDGIAQADGLLVVESPHQNNFEMPLQVEVWTTEPRSDLSEWDEAFEVHLDVGDDGLWYESPTVDRIALEVPHGSYRGLITGRGFVSEGWPGSTEPGDRWRIRLWSSDERFPPRRLMRWSPDRSADSVQAARAARRRAKQRPKRVFDMADPTRRSLIERVEHFTPPPAGDYSNVHIDHEPEVLNPRTIFQVVPSQLMLVLTGPEIGSIDPHGYLRRARTSIAEILHQISDDRAEPLRDLDNLIEDTVNFDAIDRARTPTPPT